MQAGNTEHLGAELSQAGLGCASAWGQWWFDEAKAIEIVERALELGVTVFDTGASYSGGNAEPRLGKALKKKSLDRLLISTKIGTQVNPNGSLYKDWSRNGVLKSIESSRRNLGLDTIPLLYLHGPKVSTFTSELLDTLNEARERKWVRWFGINSFDDDVLDAVADMRFFDVVMLDYNIMRIDREPMIEKLVAAGKIVVAGGALANQMHAPKFLWPRNRVDVWYALRAIRNHRRQYSYGKRLRFLSKIPGWTPSQIALAFTASNKLIGASMFGTTRLTHLEENLKAVGRKLPTDVEGKIRAVFVDAGRKAKRPPRGMA